MAMPAAPMDDSGPPAAERRFRTARTLRLGTFHIGSAMSDVLVSSVLNRVLIRPFRLHGVAGGAAARPALPAVTVEPLGRRAQRHLRGRAVRPHPLHLGRPRADDDRPGADRRQPGMVRQRPGAGRLADRDRRISLLRGRRPDLRKSLPGAGSTLCSRGEAGHGHRDRGDGADRLFSAGGAGLRPADGALRAAPVLAHGGTHHRRRRPVLAGVDRRRRTPRTG